MKTLLLLILPLSISLSAFGQVKRPSSKGGGTFKNAPVTNHRPAVRAPKPASHSSNITSPNRSRPSSNSSGSSSTNNSSSNTNYYYSTSSNSNRSIIIITPTIQTIPPQLMRMVRIKFLRDIIILHCLHQENS